MKQILKDKITDSLIQVLSNNNASYAEVNDIFQSLTNRLDEMSQQQVIQFQ